MFLKPLMIFRAAIDSAKVRLYPWATMSDQARWEPKSNGIIDSNQALQGYPIPWHWTSCGIEDNPFLYGYRVILTNRTLQTGPPLIYAAIKVLAYRSIDRIPLSTLHQSHPNIRQSWHFDRDCQRLLKGGPGISCIPRKELQKSPSSMTTTPDKVDELFIVSLPVDLFTQPRARG